MEEGEWIPLRDFPNYSINTKTLRIKNNTTGRILNYYLNTAGYPMVVLSINGKSYHRRVHRLIAIQFIPIPQELLDQGYTYETLEINHIDENSLNYNINNLEWCTHEYNQTYGTKNIRSGKSSSITVTQFDLEGNFIKNWDCIQDITREYGFQDTPIIKCCAGGDKNRTAYGFLWRYTLPEYKEGYKLDISNINFNKCHCPVAMLNPDTYEVLETFEQAAQASAKYGILRSCICVACNTGGKAGGYRWKRLPKTKEIFDINKNLDMSNLDFDLYHRPIVKLRVHNNRIIRLYDCLMDAFKDSGFTRSTNAWQDILACCQGLRPYALSQRYEFADNPIWTGGEYEKLNGPMETDSYC